jgi:hypothetical protein
MQRVFVTLAAAAFLFAVGAQAIAQQDGPAQGPPAGQSPSPTSPASPGPSAGALGQSQAATTAMGEISDVDSKGKTLTLKTAAGSEMKFKWDDATKVSGSLKDAAGLATSTGRQVTIQYKKDGQSNLASSIEVHAASPSSPAAPRSPGAPDRPGSPDSPSPRTPGAPDSPGAPRTPGAPDSPNSPRP